MSLESIYRVVSHAHKSASEASGGTLEEKGAVAVLAGLSALLEARIQLHRQATVPASAAPASAAPTPASASGAAKPKLPAAAVGAQRTPAPPVPALGKKPAGSDADDSYELK